MLFEFLTPAAGGVHFVASLPQRTLYRATTGRFQLTDDGVKRHAGEIHVVDADNGKRKASLPGLQTYLTCMAMRSDGQMLALMSSDGQSLVIFQQQENTLRVYDVATGQGRYRLAFHLNNPHLSLSPDSRLMALRDSAPTPDFSMRGRIELRDLRSGKRVASEYFMQGWPKRVEFSADSRFVLVENDHKLRLVETATGDPVGPWLPFSDSGHEDVWAFPRDFVLTPDGQTLLTREPEAAGALPSTRFRVWSLRPDNRQLAELQLEP